MTFQYEYERRKYAQDLINFDKRFLALFSGKPRTEENQDGVSHEEFSQYVFSHGIFHRNSMLSGTEHSRLLVLLPAALGFTTQSLRSSILSINLSPRTSLSDSECSRRFLSVRP